MMYENIPQIIGLAGTFAAGKDTISDALERDFEYHHISTGDMVREVARVRHNSIERPILYQTAADLRCEEGPGAMVIEALKHPERPIIVTGLRSLGEAKEIKKAGGLLVFVDAPIEIRYQRMQSRARDEEARLSLEAFEAFEKTEMYSGESDSDFNIRGIGEIADVVIDSSRELEAFIGDAYQALGLT